MTTPAQAIREFYRQDDLMEAFVAEMQAGQDQWASCIDHGDRLILIDPSRDVYAVQPGEDGKFDAIFFNNLDAAFDPEAHITEGTENRDAEAQRISSGDTPRAAFEAICRHCGLDLDMETPSP
jgi:hypothetical protein